MSFESPISVLQNLAGEEVAIVSGSALNNGEQPGVAILAKDESGNAQFLNMNASGELKVQATVDVDLDYATDSVTVYGSQGASLVQDAEDDYLLVRDNDAKNAIDGAKAAITGSIETMDSNLGGKLDTLDSSVGAVETAVDGAKSAITGSIEAFQAAFEAEDFASETTLAAFQSANHEDLMAITGSIASMDGNLGGKLDTLDSSVGAVETAVDNASAAISGSVVALGADIGGKLDTLNAVDFATETTLASLEGKDFATETTLAAFQSANHEDLMAVTSSIDAMDSNLGGKLDQFQFDAGALIVTGNLNVDVSLTQADEVTVYQGTNPWIVNDSTVSGALNSLGADLNTFASANHTDLLAIDTSVGDVETAVTNASSAISGSVVALGADLNAFASANHTDLLAIDTSVGDVETAVTNASSAISGSVVALGADLNAFASANHTDLLAIDTSVGDVETAVDNASAAISGSVVALGADLGGKLDTLDSSVGAVETAVDNASSAISGSIVALGADLGGKLDQFQFDSNALVVTGNLNVDVSLTQADEVTAFQGGAPWSVSATDLDIRDLTYVSDSVSIYGDEGVAFAQISGSGEMITVPLGSEGNSLLQAASGSIWSDVNGNGALLVGLLGSNSGNVLASNASDQLYVEVANPFDGVVTATDLDIRDLNSATDSVSAVQSGDWIVRKHATSAAVSAASASTSDAEVLASNADRMGATFFMDGNATCYIKLGGAASNSDFSVRLVNNGYYELPEGYTGAIHAIFSVSDVNIKLRCTELTYA